MDIFPFFPAVHCETSNACVVDILVPEIMGV